MLYFAYNSHISRTEFHNRIQGHYAGKAVLENYELVFNKPILNDKIYALANVAASNAKGKKVEGVLYEVEAEDADLLNGFLGGYKPQTAQIVNEHGETETATLFISNRTKSGLLPNHQELDLMIRGAKENKLSEVYIQQLQALQSKAKK